MKYPKNPTVYILQVFLSLAFIVGALGWTAYVAKACMISPNEITSSMNRNK